MSMPVAAQPYNGRAAERTSKISNPAMSRQPIKLAERPWFTIASLMRCTIHLNRRS
jgi:hypothetical protein